MTTAESVVETTRRNQEAFVHIWVDGVRKFWGLAPLTDAKIADPKVPGVPTADEVVDNAFNFAEKVLSTQREFIKSWLAASKSVASSTAWLAQSATKDGNSKKG